MRHNVILAVLLVATGLVGVRYAFAGQAPAAASDQDIPISHQDRVYSAEQFSNTVSVTDPVDSKLVGTIRLGEPWAAQSHPLATSRGQSDRVSVVYIPPNNFSFQEVHELLRQYNALEKI